MAPAAKRLRRDAASIRPSPVGGFPSFHTEAETRRHFRTTAHFRCTLGASSSMHIEYGIS